MYLKILITLRYIMYLIIQNNLKESNELMRINNFMALNVF